MDGSSDGDASMAHALPAVPTSSEMTPPSTIRFGGSTSSESAARPAQPIVELPESPRGGAPPVAGLAVPGAAAVASRDQSQSRTPRTPVHLRGASQAKAMAPGSRGVVSRGRSVPPGSAFALGNGAGDTQELQTFLRMHEQSVVLSDQRAMLLNQECALAVQRGNSEAEMVARLRAELAGAQGIVEQASAAVSAVQQREQHLTQALQNSGTQEAAAKAVAEAEAAEARRRAEEAQTAVAQMQAQANAVQNVIAAQTGETERAQQEMQAKAAQQMALERERILAEAAARMEQERQVAQEREAHSCS